MECSICKVRSAVGGCAVCQAMLCEECSIPCATCGKLVCPEHLQETRSGRRLCAKCFDEREARREQRRAVAEGRVEEPAAADVDKEIEEEAVVLAGRRAPDPWQWSVFAALGAIAIALIILLFPSLRRISLGPTAYIPTPLILVLIPIISVIWAIVGLSDERYFEDRNKCFAGLGLALLSVLLGIVAWATDPAAKAEQTTVSTQGQRETMTPEELAEWRKKNLEDRYRFRTE